MTERRPAVAEWIALGLTWIVIVAMLYPLSRSRDAVSLDFSIFYTAARMVATGQGSVLFSADAQQEAQQALFGRTTPLLFNHLPYEVLPVLPLAALDYSTAYLVWSAAQAALLVIVPVVLLPLMPAIAPLRLAIVCLAFPPAWIAVAQGQDSVMLLLLLTLSVRDLAAGRETRAGFWIALGLFKFQISLPLIVLLVLAGRWRMLRGFLPGAVAVIALSAMVTGVDGLLRYPRFLFDMASVHDLTIVPRAMLNLRGLLAVAGLADPRAAFLVVAVAGGALSLAAVWWLRGSSDVLDAASLIALSAFLSFHLNPHDASVLLIPALLGLGWIGSRPVTLSSLLVLLGAAVIWSPWTYVVLPGPRLLALASVAIVALHAGLAGAARRLLA